MQNTKRNICLKVKAILFGIVLILTGVTVSGRDWHVCMRCEKRQVMTVEDALRAAQAGDTIYVYYEPEFPILLEHLVIDKPVKIIGISEKGTLEDFDAHPVLSTSGTRFSEVIDIRVPGVTLIGLNITNLAGLPVLDKSVSEDNMFDEQVGIRLRAPATVKYCQITRCRTGILIRYDTSENESGSLIEHCRVGQPTFDKWEDSPSNHPGCFTGIVILPDRSEKEPYQSEGSPSDPSPSGRTPSVKPQPGNTELPEAERSESNQEQSQNNMPVQKSGPVRPADIIRATSVIANRFYGIVFTPGTQPVLEDNLIELNGKQPYRIAKEANGNPEMMVWIDP